MTDLHNAEVAVPNLPVFYCSLRGLNTRYYFNVRSKADISQLNLPHGEA